MIGAPFPNECNCNSCEECHPELKKKEPSKKMTAEDYQFSRSIKWPEIDTKNCLVLFICGVHRGYCELEGHK